MATTVRVAASPNKDALALIADTGAPSGSELERLLTVRVPDLMAYQSKAYARRYAELVGRVRAAEERSTRAAAGPLAEAVAIFAYKLMAYKDEYEVARLQIDPRLQQELEAEFGPGARVAWKLHPPMLRALGLKRKLTLGSWFRPAFRFLYAMRRLRGTVFDPFGYAAVRRLERDLIDEYIAELDNLIQHLAPTNHMIAVEIAGLPDIVRGYEHIKTANAERYRTELEEARRRFDAARPELSSLAI